MCVLTLSFVFQLSEAGGMIKSMVNPTTGSTLVCDVRPCNEPDVPLPATGSGAGLLPEPWMNVLRECFKERFQATSRALDVSSLHTDISLLNKGYFIPLNKTIVFSSFIAILQENNAKVSSRGVLIILFAGPDSGGCIGFRLYTPARLSNLVLTEALEVASRVRMLPTPLIFCCCLSFTLVCHCGSQVWG